VQVRYFGGREQGPLAVIEDALHEQVRESSWRCSCRGYDDGHHRCSCAAR
jgi:hypothetical protein